jgi:hypothetical protein
VLRDHPIFSAPIAVDRSTMIDRPWPAEWSDPHDQDRIRVLPLSRREYKGERPGWCTYTRDMAEAPEIEVFCGGINLKTATAAALWRQGNLLHYGFDLSPDEMTEAGKAMLVDAIAYISRFTEDRPIMETPSPFAGDDFITRAAIERIIARNDAGWWDHLSTNFDRKALADAGVTDLASFAKWYPTARDYLCPDATARMRIDEDARAVKISPGRPAFFDRAIAALSDAGEASHARRMLARYAPDGPGRDATRQAWSDWCKANADYLFFGEVGGYRWYLDPLAKARGVPTARLRGPMRASRR